MGDRLTLTWSDFQKFVAVSFSEARSTNDFADVTLVGEDYEIEAHRLVLSAGSNFFQDLFRRAKHEHPLIYLKGTYKVEIEAILSFLYNAEVNIAQENLTQFLLTSKDLKIRGVLEDELDSEPSSKGASENLPDLDNSDSSNMDPRHFAGSERQDIFDQEGGEDFSYKETQAKKASVRCHFQKVTETESVCNLCEKVIQTKGGNTTGMWRHMSNMHKDVDVWKTILERLTSSSVLNHFISTTDVESTCKLCDQVISTETDSEGLWKHIASSHQNEEEASDSKEWFSEKLRRQKRHCSNQPWEERKSSNPIWSHYQRLPGYLAKCRVCDRFGLVQNKFIKNYIAYPKIS